MKKSKVYKSLVVLTALLLSVGNMWGTDYNYYTFGFNDAIITAYGDGSTTKLSNPSHDGTVVDISSYGSSAVLTGGDANVTSSSSSEKENCVSISNDASQNYGQNYVEIASTENIKEVYLVAAVTGSTTASSAVAVGWTGTPGVTITEYHTFTTPGKGNTSGNEITISFTSDNIKYVRLYRKIKLDSSTKTTFTNSSSTTIPTSASTYGIAFIKVKTIAAACGETAQAALNLSASSGSVCGTGTTTFTVSGGSGTGALSVSSSDATKATASISGSTVTVTGVAAGSATITVTKACDATYAEKTATYTATVNAVPTANAGADKTTEPETGVALGATAAASGCTGAWTIQSGPNTSTSQLSSTSSATATFTPTAAGTYTLRWTVTNSTTSCSAYDDMTVTAAVCSISDCGNTTLTYPIYTSGDLTTSNLFSSATSSNSTAVTVGASPTFTGVTVSSASKGSSASAGACYAKSTALTGKMQYSTSSKSSSYYIDFPFTVNTGYTFTPCDVQVVIQPVSSAQTFTVEITDGTNVYGASAATNLASGVMAPIIGLTGTSAMSAGDYAIRLYPHGGSSKEFRMGANVILKGTTATACTAPDHAAISGGWHVFPGDTINLTATAYTSGGDAITEDVTYQWYRNGTAEGNKIAGATSRTYIKEHCTFDDAGVYYCKTTKCGTTVTSTQFSVKMLRIYFNNGRGGGDYGYVDLQKVNSTTAQGKIFLGASWTYAFCVADGVGHYYGCNNDNDHKMWRDNCTNWTMNADGIQCLMWTDNGATYTFTVNYSTITAPVVTATYPPYNQAAGINIYFDNHLTNWSNLHYRIGHTTWTTKTEMTTKVSGTANLYKYTTVKWDGLAAWHICNNSGWSDENSIYKTKTGDSYAITASTNFEGGAASSDMTLIPTGSHKTGGEDQNNNCQFYSYNVVPGMATDRVIISPYEHGTITVNYTNTSNVASTLTSGYADLAHTVILTSITAVPATGYDASAITINGGAYSANYVVTGATTIAATFTPKTITITWNPTSGSVDPTSSSYTYDGETVDLPTPTRTGYDFAGWWTGAGGTGTQITEIGTTNKPSSDVTYHAKWTPKNYDLTWNLGGGTTTSAGTGIASGVSANTTSSVAYGTSLTAPTVTKTGYNFSAWSPSVASTMPAAATTYTATWTAKTTTITINANTANHGSTTPGTVTATYGSALPSFTAATGESGYSLTGYWTDATSGTKIINADGTLVASTTYADGSGNWKSEAATLTLYAQYDEECTPQSVVKTVMSSTTAGTTTGYNEDEYAGSPTIVEFQGTPISGGYKLKSGSKLFVTLAKGNFIAGDKINIVITQASDLTNTVGKLPIFYDASSPKHLTTIDAASAGTYTYTLTASDITTLGSVKTIGVFRSSSTTENNPYVKSVEVEGCRDWVIEGDGLVKWTMNLNTETWGAASTSTSDGTNISSIATSRTAGGSGTSTSATAKVSMAEAEITTTASPTNYAEFTFTIASGKKVVPEKVTCKVFNVASGNRTYKAQLSDSKGHVYNSTNTVAVTTEATLTAATFNFASDLTLIGDVTMKVYAWDTDGSKDPTEFRMGQYVKLFGEVEALPVYTITLDNQGADAGVWTTDFTVHLGDDDYSFGTSIISPEKADSIYGGYYTEKYGGGVQVINNSGTINASVTGYTDASYNWIYDGDVTLYAQWREPETYNITYHLNGASWVGGYTAPATYKEGTGATLPLAGNMTNVGYTFGGWYANEELTGGAKTSIGTAEAGDKEFWAKWTENTYTVTYDANGGTGDMSATVGHYVTLSDNTYTKSGYAFSEWNTAADGSGISYHEGEEIELTADLDLYAIWATDYNITWGNVQIGGAGATVTPNLGGGNYTITASVSDWTGTLTAAMLTAETAGLTITNVSIDNSSSPKTITATFSVGATVAGDTVALLLSLPAAGVYGAKDSEKVIDIERCAGGENILTLSWFSTNTPSNSVSNKPDSEGKYSFVYSNSAKTSEYAYTYTTSTTNNKGQGTGDNDYMRVDRGTNVNIYADNTTTGGTPTTFSGVTAISLKVKRYHNVKYAKMSISIGGTSVVTDSSLVNVTNTAFTTWTFSGLSNLSGKITITNGGPADGSSASSDHNFLIDDIVITRVGGGGSGRVATSLTWSPALASGATVDKYDTDGDFTYAASTTSNTLGTITYTSSDATVATVNSSGKVHILKSGVTTITATLAESGCYESAAITYTLNVISTCADVAGTLSATNLGCDGIQLTVSGHTGEGEVGTVINWYKDGDWQNNASYNNKATVTVTAAGEWYAQTTAAGVGHCVRNSNSITVAASESVTASKIVDEWYVKNGRRTPDVALVQTANAVNFSVAFANGGTKIWDSSTGTPVTTGFGGCDFHINESTGVIYLNGSSSAGAAPTGMTVGDTTITITAQGCGSSASVTVRLHVQDATTYKTIAYVVDGTKGGAWDAVTSGHADGTQLYEYLDSVGTGAGARKFMLSERNIYKTVDEKLIREHYSQFDAILITDDPNTSTKDGKKSYVDAFGTMIDVRPLLTMEAYVSALANWSCVKGSPTSPNPRQYTMRLQCKDHEIYSGLPAPAAGTHVWSETIDGDEYRFVIMVDSTKSPYEGVAYNSQTSDKPALQGFSSAAMGDLLGLGVISNGALQAGIERQEEPAARMMILGINNKALPNALTDEGKKVIENALTYLLKTNMEEVDDCSNFFKGGTVGHETDWNTTTNWQKGTLPTFETKVRILAPCEVSGITPRVAQVDIAASGTSSKMPGGTCSGSLTIKPDGGLIVAGKVRSAVAPYFNNSDLNPTTPAILTIEANSTNTGALILDNSDGTTQATVEMYSKSYWEIVAGKKKKYWSYVGVPITDVDIPNYFYLGFTYLYDETTGWIKKSDGSVLQPFEGIGLAMQTGHKETFQGTLASTETQEIALTKTTSGGNGENLIGNSWTAPIQITAFEASDFGSATATVSVYNSGRDDVAHNPTYVTATEENDGAATAGQWLSVPISVSKLGGYTGLKVIPAMQAFQVTTGSATTLTLDYDKLVRPATNTVNAPMRAPKRKAPPQAEIEGLLRVRVSGETTHTDVWLLQDERFDYGFDNGWEASYQECDERSAQLYALSEIGKMAFLAQPEIDGTVLGFAPSRDGDEYTFSFHYLGNETLYLNDLKQQNSTLISEENIYRFTYEEGDTHRFLISATPFGAPGITTGVSETGDGARVQKIIYRDHVYIIRGGRIYDVVGKVVK